jgi:metallophosphoesterase (TIGR00282 family)
VAFGGAFMTDSSFSLLFIGDVVGRSGRDAVAQHLPGLIQAHRPELVVLNGENAAGGFGITAAIGAQFFDLGVDVITTGNHIWDQREITGFIDSEPRLLRPLNFPKGTPGNGVYVTTGRTGKRVLVANIMLRLFMDAMDDPFAAIDRVMKQAPLGGAVDAILVDVHGEATSEKMAMGQYLDGRASLVVGTHTHVPTADHHIMSNGTAYQTDAGMTGDYRSVIGMKAEPAIYRFTRKMPSERLTPAEGEGTLCGCLVRVGDKGKALAIEPVRCGGALAPSYPATPD